MQDLNALAQKMSSDPAFVRELAADPEAALKKHNFEVPNEVLNTMKGLSEAELTEMAANYSEDKAAC
jgi:hypothetical protein